MLKRWFFRPISVTVISFLGVLFLFNSLFLKPQPVSAFEQGEIWLEIHQYRQAEQSYRAWLEEYPADLDAHYRYLQAVFALPLSERPFAALEARYSTLMITQETFAIGSWGKAWIQLYQGNSAAAVHTFQKIESLGLKYTHLGIGQAYLHMEQYDLAQAAFWKEIHQDGAWQQAVRALFSTTLYLGKNYEAVSILDSVAGAVRVVDQDDLRKLAFAVGDWNLYFDQLLFFPIRVIHVFAIGSSLFLAAIWFFYFWRIDIFEQEPLWISLLVMAAGGLMTGFAVMAEDLLQNIYPLFLNGDLFNDLMVSIGYIGLVEEFFKFLPVMFVFFFSKQINEPVDLIIYASLSALGFATVENIVVISQVGERIMIARLLIATLMHMASTAVFAYMWASARFIYRTKLVVFLIIGWICAGGLHGLFDYLVLSPSSQVALTPLLVLVITIWLYGMMLRNSLNFSPFFSHPVLVTNRLVNYEWILSAGWWVLTLGYLFFYVQFSSAVANVWILSNLWTTLPVVLGIFSALGELSLKKGEFVFP